jgi:hypothetical protein
VTFDPTQAGPITGSLTVGATNVSSPLDVSLTGAGEDFQLQVTGSSSAVIVNGQTATYTVQVIPVNGSSGTLTMGCTGAPQNSTCTINPVLLPVSAVGSGSATVTVTTGISSANASEASPFARWMKASIALAALLPCVFFGFWKRTLSARALLVLLLAIVLLVPIACGTHASGGSSSTSPSGPQGPITPSGVYTLNITASIPGLQRNVPVSLTVQ